MKNSIPRPLRRPDEKIADPGTLRLGDSLISAVIPQLRVPGEKIADPGTLRLGDSLISARFPRL